MNPPSDTEAPHRKRTRSGSGDDGERIEKICEELWFEDGNIVIACQAMDKTKHLFKVHKSVLSTHSPVFRDLFALPQPLIGDQGKETDTYDGLPLVVFTDAPDDVHDLLAALYYPTRLVCRRNSRSTFKKIAGVLRLSTKYELSELRKHVKSILDTDWPSDFEAWEANEAEMDKTDKSAKDVPISAEIIHLAMECRINSVLPAAFYNISRDAFVPSDLCHIFHRQGEIGQCTSDDLHRVIAGREALRSHAWEIYRDGVAFRWKNSKCTFHEDEMRDTCHVKLKEWWTSTAVKYLFAMEDLLGALKMIIGCIDQKLSDEVCLNCRKRLMEWVRTQQVDVWDNLSVYFDVFSPPILVAVTDPEPDQ